MRVPSPIGPVATGGVFAQVMVEAVPSGMMESTAMVMFAVGQQTDLAYLEGDTVLSGISRSPWNTLDVDGGSFETNVPGVFAGGDIIRGAATVILAMGDGSLRFHSLPGGEQRLVVLPSGDKNGAVALTTEAAHSAPRILHARGNQTGWEIELSLSALARQEGDLPALLELR